MTITMTLVVEHGYDMKGAQNYATGKDVYRRATGAK
jgi:hypothetical protein